MAKQMQGKVCVITGGAGSIGQASAKLLHAEGAKVMLTDLNEAALKEAAARIGGDSSVDNLAWCAADVTKSDQVKNAIAATVSRFGKIDVLFSNAGNFGTVAPISEYPGYITAKHAQVGLMRVLAKELAGRNIRVNTVHPGPVDNAFQLNVEQKLGAIIGRDGTQFFNDIIPLHRHVRPEEVASSVLFLASDASSFTTGSLLMVDGGMSI
jgi:NAD(P)-dependent dehydrogenase (short-subunit alcohol dehydrogenase family)